MALWFFEETVSNLSTVRFVAHQQYFKFLDIMDQKLSKAIEQLVFCFLVASITNFEHQDLDLESSGHLIVNASEFPPVPFNFDISV